MGLWSKKVEESKLKIEDGVLEPSFSETNPETESGKGGFSDSFEDSEEEPSQEQDKKKDIDWEERHFQICLALISRTDVSNGHANNVVPVKIIKAADQMVEALKKHYHN